MEKQRECVANAIDVRVDVVGRGDNDGELPDSTGGQRSESHMTVRQALARRLEATGARSETALCKRK